VDRVEAATKRAARKIARPVEEKPEAVEREAWPAANGEWKAPGSSTLAAPLASREAVAAEPSERVGRN
jgi:hypothetical protein